MRFLSLFTLSAFTVSYVIAQVPPVIYPANGTYYIYNVQYKRVFDDFGFVIAEGNPIIGWYPIIHDEQSNQQWLVETADHTTSHHKVTMRCVETVQQQPSAGGYVAKIDGNIVHSHVGEVWMLQPVPKSADQFMIMDCLGKNAIAFDHGTASNTKEAQLTVDAANTSATNQRWIFIPVDQMADFVRENGSG